MANIHRHTSGAKWETLVGYCRVVEAGNMVEVAGTTAVDAEGNIVGSNDAYEQTRFILEKITLALQKAGVGMDKVTRTRMYVTDIDQWEAIAQAHAEVFAAHPPVATMVEVSRLIDPALLVEIEVSAYKG